MYERVRSATSLTASTFGVLAGLGGLRHGVGEVRQGNLVRTAPKRLIHLASIPSRILERDEEGNLTETGTANAYSKPWQEHLVEELEGLHAAVEGAHVS